MSHASQTYLNHAGTSWPKPASVVAATNTVMNSQPTQWPDLFRSAHCKIAEHFGIRNKSRLLLTPSCTTALHLGISDHAWTDRDRIITSSMEHHAVHRPVVKLVEFGVRHTAVPRTETEPFCLEALEKELRQGDVRLVALSAASNVTGELLPIAEAIPLAHQYGALVLVDGAQVAGWLDLNLEELSVDLFAFAGHKALQGPWGIGGLYVASDVSLNTAIASCELENSEIICGSMPGFCDSGSVPLTSLAGLAAAVEWLNHWQLQNRLNRARNLASRFTDCINQHPQIKIQGSSDVSCKVPTVSVTASNRTNDVLKRVLLDSSVVVSSGLQCAPQAHQSIGTSPEGAIRFSFGPNSLESDVDRALSALLSAVKDDDL